MFKTLPKNTMRGWDFSSNILREARAGIRMLNPSLDLGNPCNLNCHYCFTEHKGTERKRRQSDELTKEETLYVISDFARAGAQTVNIVGAGEPLIDPLFPLALRTIARLGMVPVVFTHGAEIGKRPSIVDVLQETEATVVIKLNSWNAELQDAVVGKSGYSECRNQAIKLLLERGFARDNPTRLAIDTLAFKGNLRELPSIHLWARKNNVFPITAGFIPTGRALEGVVDGSASLRVVASLDRRAAEMALKAISNDDAAWLRARLKKIDDQFGVPHAPIAAYFGGGTCSQILGLYVDVLGHIWPCVARQRVGFVPSRAPLGSIRYGDSPSEVWSSHPYMAWIRRSYDGGCPYKQTGLLENEVTQATMAELCGEQ